MSLLAPWFLAGLGLLAVPVIIHLTQRQRSRVTVFPSLMFLRQLPFKARNRRRIRHPLLFALRCAALALLALAFARPFLDAAGEAEGEAARDVVLLVDVSASLGYGERWAAAQDSARAVLAGLGEGDRVAVATFAEDAEERLALTPGTEAARDALAELAPSDVGTRLEAGLQIAGRILADSDRREREVALVSDFQRAGWEDGGRVRLPDGVRLRALSVVEAGRGGEPVEAPNVAIVGAALRAGEAGRARLLARLANLGPEAVSSLPVTLEIAGRGVATIPVDLPPRGGGTVAFNELALPEGRSRGRLVIPGDGLALDDEFRFVAEPAAGLAALILESERGRADASLFLERALAIGDAPRIAPTRSHAARLDGSLLAPADFVVLNDADLTDAGRAGALRDWVAAGGGLLIALGPGVRPERWSDAGLALLGAEPGRRVDDAAGRRLSWLDYDHPAFELFAAPRSGDFSGARFLRFWSVEPREGTAVLARFDSGEPALLEHSLGEGRVLLWTSTLDRFWNDLALQPVFLPFAHRLALRATGYREAESWLEAGDVRELAGLAGLADAADGEWVLVDPTGDRSPVEDGEGPVWIDFPQVGFYQLETREEAGRGVTVAVNAPLDESDLTTVAPERVVEAASGVAPTDGAAPTEPGIDGNGTEGDAAARTELWWPLLWLAALVLGAESVLANRWTRRHPASALTNA